MVLREVPQAKEPLEVGGVLEQIRVYCMRHKCTVSSAVDALRDQLEISADARSHFERAGMISVGNKDQHIFNHALASGAKPKRDFRTFLRFQHKSPHGQAAWEGLQMRFEGAGGKVKPALDFTSADVAHKEGRDASLAIAYAKRRKVDRDWLRLLERFSVSVTRDLPDEALRELDKALKKAHS